MTQGSLFEHPTRSLGGREIPLPDAELYLYENAFSALEATRHYEGLCAETAWRYDEILIHGRQIPLPRLQAWYSDQSIPIAYSGMSIVPLEVTPRLGAIGRRVYELSGHHFNGVLVTLYRDGNDSVGWHSDDEIEFGPDPIIASVSLGATRDFVLKHKHRVDVPRVKVPLGHGSLLVMGRGSQVHWAHQLPKRKGVTDPRINLTFRNVSRPNR